MNRFLKLLISLFAFSISTFLICVVLPQPKFDQQFFESLALESRYEGSNICKPDDTSCSVPDHQSILDGITVVVTGSTSGIGYSLVKLIHSLGAEVITIGRSTTKLSNLAQELGNKRVVSIIADHSDLESISQAANMIKKKTKKVDFLINNAGFNYQNDMTSYLYLNPTKQGYDMLFGVNYLSHFLLTEKMLPLLKKSEIKSPRIINVSSSYHWSVSGTDLTTDNKNQDPIASRFDLRTPLLCARAYGNSKLAQILHVRSLRRRLALPKESTSLSNSSYYSKVKIVGICPGWVSTNISTGVIKTLVNSLGFRADGAGLSSILYAMFQPGLGEDESNDFVSSMREESRNFFLGLASYFSSDYILRDVFSNIIFVAQMVLQKVIYNISTKETSKESYDMLKQESLHEWSLNTVAQWI